MARRPTAAKSTRLLSQVPPVTTSAQAVASSRRFSQQLFGIGQMAQNFKDRIAVDQATLAGAIAGRSGQVEPRRDSTLTGRAYDQAARRSYVTTLETKARAQLNTAFEQNKLDPAKLQDAFAGVRSGTLNALKETFPEVAGDMDAVISRLSAPLMRTASDAYLASVKGTAAGESAAYIDAMTDDASRRATDSEDIAQVAQDLAIERNNLHEHMISLGPPAPFISDGVQMGEDAERLGVYTPVQITQRLQDFDDRMITSNVLGGMDSAINQGGGVSFIRAFQGADIAIAPELKEEIMTEMVQRLNRDLALRAKAEGDADTSRADAWEAGEQAATELFVNRALDLQTIQAMVQSEQLKPSLARSLAAAVEKQGPLSDDPAAVLEIRLDPIGFSEGEILATAGITDDTKIDLIERRRTQVEDAAGWRNSPNGAEGVRRIKARFGMVNGIIATFTTEEVNKADRALTELFDSVGALPLEERELRAVEMADQVIGNINRVDAGAALDVKRRKLQDNTYQTQEQIDADGSLETVFGAKKDTYRIESSTLKTLLNDIERLEREAQE